METCFDYVYSFVWQVSADGMPDISSIIKHRRVKTVSCRVDWAVASIMSSWQVLFQDTLYFHLSWVESPALVDFTLIYKQFLLSFFI